MKHPISRRRPALLLPVLLAGCTPAALELSPDLAPAERLAVDGRGGFFQPKEIRFGGYAATAIDRSWTKGSGMSIGIGSKNRAKQDYGFRFVDGDGELGSVTCEATASRGTVSLPVVDIDAASAAGLRCHLASASGGPDLWALELGSERDHHLAGYAGTQERRFRISAKGPGGGFTPASLHGFEIRDGERVVAAVETVNKGAVWLAPELPAGDRQLLAGVAAALLLYQELPTD